MSVQRYEWGLLILRIVSGITFLVHGIAKFQMGLDRVFLGNKNAMA